MKKKKFKEIAADLLSENEEKLKGKKAENVPFSRKKKATLTQALLNENDYETQVVKVRNGEILLESANPVREFRKRFIEDVLIDNGIDKQAAAEAGRNYEFSMKQAEALHDFESEDIEQFLRAGFTWKFNEKSDFCGGLKMKKIPEHDETRKNPENGEEINAHILEHMALVKKGGTPKSCRKSIK